MPSAICFNLEICVCCQIQIFVFILGDKIAHSQNPFWGGKYMVNTKLIPPPPFSMVLIPEIRSIDFSIPISSVSSILLLVEHKRTG